MKKFKIKLIVLVFMLVIMAGLSFAREDPNHWNFAGYYGGGCYPNVEFDPNIKERVYLVSDVAGIWRSTDGGENWNFMNRGLGNLNVSFISIAPSDSDILYAGTAGGLFVWRVQDQSWSFCDSKNGEIYFIRPGNHRSLAISRSDPEVIFAGTASGAVFHSIDGGQNWNILGNMKKPFKTNDPITSVAYNESGKILYAASAKGIAIYSFETNSWLIPDNGPSRVTDFVLDGESTDKLYAAGSNCLFISEDQGKTWKQSAPIPAGISYRVSVFNSPAGALLAVAWKKDWTGGVALSRDNGKTWTLADSNLSADMSNPTRSWAYPGIPVTAVKIDPFDKGVMFRADWWGVWRSDDGGVSWKEKIKGAPNVVGSDIVIGATGNIYGASMDDGLVVSRDEGNSYHPLFPLKGYNKDINGHVWRVLVFGEKDDKIIATTSPWGDPLNQIILSFDAGATFTIVRSGLPSHRPKINTIWEEGYPRALAADPKNPDILYLGIDGDDGGGLYLSNDGGRNWVQSKGQPDSRKIYNALAVNPLDPSTLYWGACGQNGGVYLSGDKGLTWKRVFSDMTWVFDLKVAANGKIYAAGSKNGPHLYVSFDEGKNWELLKKFSGSGAVDAITLDPDNPDRILVSTVQWGCNSGGKIYLSEDAGISWEDITGDLPPGSGAAAMAYDLESGYLYIIRYAGSVYKTDIGAATQEDR